MDPNNNEDPPQSRWSEHGGGSEHLSPKKLPTLDLRRSGGSHTSAGLIGSSFDIEHHHAASSSQSDGDLAPLVEVAGLPSVEHALEHNHGVSIPFGPTFISPLPIQPAVEPVPAMLGDTTIRSIEKDGDNTASPLVGLRDGHRVGRHSTPTALTRLLASTSTNSPAQSRSTSYANGNPNLVRQSE